MGKSIFGPGEPLKKITVRIPQRHIDYLQKQADESDESLAFAATMALVDGISTWKREDEAEARRKREEEREKRKADGYWKRTLRHYGIDGD